MTTRRKPILVFDVNETLLDLEHLTPFFVEVFGDGAVMREWFAQMVLYSQTLTLAGAYMPFAAIGAGVLRMLGTIKGRAVTDEHVAGLGALTRTMPAHPDVAPSLAAPRGGFRLATLTNSAPDPDGGALRKAGIDHFFEARFSVDRVRRFKPAPETYAMVLRDRAVAAEAICLVAAHVWDTLGAQLIGATAALLLRPGNAPLPLDGLPQPTLVTTTMTDLADQVVAVWGDV